MTHPTVDFINFLSTIFSKISVFLFANIRHVSSANSVVLKLDTFGKSLTCSEKSRGDKIEPCGKPQLICWVWDLHLLLLYIGLAQVNNFQKVIVGALECRSNVPTSTAAQNGQQYHKLLRDQGKLHKLVFSGAGFLRYTQLCHKLQILLIL